MDSLEEKRRWLEKSLKENKISQEYFEKASSELDIEISALQKTLFEKSIGQRLDQNPTLTFEDGHFITHLSCPKCDNKGIVAHYLQEFKLLGKDKDGYLYFECPKCTTHLKWDSITGEIKSNKGILGYIFNKFS